MQRFLRTELLLGKEALKKLHSSTVLIAGLGAVGGMAAESLARSGIGTFILVDFDKINESNINRQILALSSTCGCFKTYTAEKRIKDINPYAGLESHNIFIDADTAPPLLQKYRPDIVIDAIDSLNPKVNFIYALHNGGYNFISSMGAAYRKDPSKICTGDLNTVANCPLASIVRKRLRKMGIDGGVECVYSKEKPFKVKEAVENSEMPETHEYIRGRKRAALGSMSTVTMAFGLHIAARVMERLICDVGQDA